MSKHLSAALIAQPENQPNADTWEECLQSLIDPNWRPGQYNHELLLLTPDPDDEHTKLHRCPRPGCDLLLASGVGCSGCRSDAEKQNLPIRELSKKLRVAPRFPTVDRSQPRPWCLVGCERPTVGLGLCQKHFEYSKPQAVSVEEYASRAKMYGPLDGECVKAHCSHDQAEADTQLCTSCHYDFQRNRKSQGKSLALWLADWERTAELPDPRDGQPLSPKVATWFQLMPGTTGLELLHAIQVRDEVEHLDPNSLRRLTQAVRKSGLKTFVGQSLESILWSTNPGTGLIGLANDTQRTIERAHRDWTGEDPRPERIIYLNELNLGESEVVAGPRATLNMTGYTQQWIVETITAYQHSFIRSKNAREQLVTTWRVADEVLGRRNRSLSDVGKRDVDAIVSEIRSRYPHKATQRKKLGNLWLLIDFGRNSDELEHIWGQVPREFNKNPALHQPIAGNAPTVGTTSKTKSSGEAFRFVPAPIVDHMMENLELFVRHDEYSTMEGRVSIYVAERFGRRTGEFRKLKDACITYDSDGDPYLEYWDIKKNRPGTRLPMDQSTHDLLRWWQQYKRDQGVTSEWLFPAPGSRTDKARSSGVFQIIMRDFRKQVTEKAPYSTEVEGSKGNLIWFDMNQMDIYSFRHAYAQRHADQVNTDGDHAFSQREVADLLGHESINTTSAYFEVTAARLKRAVSQVPQRQISFTFPNDGEPASRLVPASGERSSFERAIQVNIGGCQEPRVIASGGQECELDFHCELCPMLLTGPLDRPAIEAKAELLEVKREEAIILKADPARGTYLEARIKALRRILGGIDAYLRSLPTAERNEYATVLAQIAEVQKRAKKNRNVDVIAWIKEYAK